MNRKHRVAEHLTRTQVMMCVWAELHWQQPLCISTQGFLSAAVEDVHAAGCSQSHSADTQLCSPGSHYSAHQPKTPLYNNRHIQTPHLENVLEKLQSRHVDNKPPLPPSSLHLNTFTVLCKSGQPLSFEECVVVPKKNKNKHSTNSKQVTQW